jgi:hypothetical protein
MELYDAAARLLDDNCAEAECPELAIALQLNIALVLQRVAEEASHKGDDDTVMDFVGYVLEFLDVVLTIEPGNAKAQRRRLQAVALCRRSVERVSSSVLDRYLPCRVV